MIVLQDKSWITGKRYDFILRIYDGFNRYLSYFFSLLNVYNTVNINPLIITIVAPVGKFSTNEANIPMTTDKIEIEKDSNIILLKLSAICSALIAGNMIRLDINIAPTIFTPTTMVIDWIIPSMMFISLILIFEIWA